MKPITPKTKMLIAEIFEDEANSSFVGFFKTCHTRLHLMKKEFREVKIFIKYEEITAF